jgi:hypothetical protein
LIATTPLYRSRRIIAAEPSDWLLGSDGSHGARAAAAAAGY